MPKSKKGFTLIELLVVISIIAVLSTIGMIIYGQVTMNARDARRKLDLQNIAQALEVYYQKNGSYPIVGWTFSGNFDGSPNTNWTDGFGLVSQYISSMPVDPKNNYSNFFTLNNNGLYGYGYCGDKLSCYDMTGCESIQNGQWYILMTKLENHNDPDINGPRDARKYKWCNGDPVIVWSSYNMFVTPK